MNRKPSGFTLMEILVVMGIIGVVAAMMIPSIMPTSSTKLTASARTVMADLLYAQSQAITNQDNVYVVFSTTSSQYRLQSPLGTNIKRSAGADVVTMGSYNKEMPFAKLGALATGDVAFTTLGFDALGQPYTVSGTGANIALTQPGLIKLVSPDESFTITLSVQPFTGEVTAQ